MRINLEKQNKLWLVLGILAFMILLVVIIVSIVKNLSSDNSTPKTKIENWNTELPEVPQLTRDAAEEQLYSRIEQNSPSNIPTSGAEIRKNSQYSIHKNKSQYVLSIILPDKSTSDFNVAIVGRSGEGNEDL